MFTIDREHINSNEHLVGRHIKLVKGTDRSVLDVGEVVLCKEVYPGITGDLMKLKHLNGNTSHAREGEEYIVMPEEVPEPKTFTTDNIDYDEELVGKRLKLVGYEFNHTTGFPNKERVGQIAIVRARKDDDELQQIEFANGKTTFAFSGEIWEEVL